jgi:hypothetical protein
MPPPYKIADLGPLDLTGYLVPCDSSGSPVAVTLPGSNATYIAVYSTAEKLWSLCSDPAFDVAALFEISNPAGFVRDMEKAGFYIIVDPHYGADGRVRYTLIRPQGPAAPN